MFLIGIIVFSQIASKWLWSERQLVKPIIIDTRVDIERRLIEVSYIVNRDDDTTRLQSVNLGEETFYTIGANNMFLSTPPVNDLQQFTYYAVRSEAIRIEDNQYDYLMENLHLLNEANVSLSTYESINVKPTFITKTLNDSDSLITSFEANGDGNVRVILESKTNLVIDTIKIIHPTATYEKMAELPLNLKENQKLDIQLNHVFSFFRYGYLDVIVIGTENNEVFEGRYLTNFYDLATEKFIRAYVKEAKQ